MDAVRLSKADPPTGTPSDRRSYGLIFFGCALIGAILSYLALSAPEADESAWPLHVEAWPGTPEGEFDNLKKSLGPHRAGTDVVLGATITFRHVQSGGLLRFKDSTYISFADRLQANDSPADSHIVIDTSDGGDNRDTHWQLFRNHATLDCSESKRTFHDEDMISVGARQPLRIQRAYEVRRLRARKDQSSSGWLTPVSTYNATTDARHSNDDGRFRFDVVEQRFDMPPWQAHDLDRIRALGTVFRISHNERNCALATLPVEGINPTELPVVCDGSLPDERSHFVIERNERAFIRFAMMDSD